MSEEFDREAEKEALRQQLEAEESARRSTQHLSELLLKGATMTNRHCDECGDPIFRYEGREFCPTCQREVEGGGEATETDVDAHETPSVEDEVNGTAETEPTGGQLAHAPAGETAAGSVDGADLEAARAALARKLTALAREAEAATDVHRTRSLLEATREAAEALHAVEGLDR